MIKNEIIQKIGILVKQGHLSQRQIAKAVDVSRGTVQAVANGKRAEIIYPRVQRPIWVVPTGQPKRCQHCGSWAKMPCLSCQIFAMDQESMVLESKE